METEYLKDIYNDFFGTSTSIQSKSNDEVLDVDFENEIDKLYLNDESKELFRKIVNYIYNFDQDKRYIPFNITILSKTENTIDKIVNILKSASNKSKYLKTNKSIKLSFYGLSDETLSKTSKENSCLQR